MGAPARFYEPFAEALRDAGLAVVLADLRGTGDSGPPPSRSSRYGYAELADDVGAVLAALKPRFGDRPLVLVGHSLGGQLALLRLATHPESTVDGVVLVAVGLPYWRLYPGRSRLVILGYTQAIGATAALLRFWPGWTFGGRQARGVIRDWAATARTGRFPRLDGVDAEAAVRELRLPVLAISFDGDRYTPHTTLDHLVDKLPAASVTRERHRAVVAEGRPVHFSWVRAPGTLTDRIAAFARSVGGGG
jgi:predicted alpha/beta hydrolase